MPDLTPLWVSLADHLGNHEAANALRRRQRAKGAVLAGLALLLAAGGWLWLVAAVMR